MSQEIEPNRVLRYAADALAIVDENGSVLWATGATERIAGVTAAEAVGTSLMEWMHPDDVSRALEAFTSTLTMPGQRVPLDLRIRHANRDWIDVEVIAENALEDPQVRGVVLTIRELSQRRRADAVLELIARGEPLFRTLTALTELIRSSFEDAPCIAMVDERSPRDLRVAAWSGNALDIAAGLATRAEEGGITPIREALAAADPVAVLEVTALGFDELAPGSAEQATADCWVVPLRATRDGPLGCILVFPPRPWKPGANEWHLLERSVGLATLAVERARNENQLEHEALHDALTGLPNRAALRRRFSDTTPTTADRPATSAVLFLDLDGFKRVNDRLGHLAGDRVLVSVAGRLGAALRGGDFVARFGGDEFVVIVSSPATPGDVESLANRLIRELQKPFTIGGEAVSLGVSIGGALAATGQSISPEDLLSEADRAMYAVKAEGRGSFQLTIVGEPRTEKQDCTVSTLEE